MLIEYYRIMNLGLCFFPIVHLHYVYIGHQFNMWLPKKKHEKNNQNRVSIPERDHRRYSQMKWRKKKQQNILK